MEKKIQDYLPLYVGQKVFTGTGTVILVAVQVEVTPCTDFKAIVLNGNQVHAASRPEELKPLLRPLSSITEQECVDIARLAYGEEIKDIEGYEWVKDIMYESREFDMRVVCFLEGNYVCIYLNRFSIENRDDFEPGKSYCHYDVHNMPEIVRYMCKKGIDIFHLIPSGLAIDKTKTP